MGTPEGPRLKPICPFKSDTELQKLKIDKAGLDLNPIPKEMEFELQDLASQLEVLEEENRELQEIVTLLTAKESKKLKTPRLSPDQTLPF